MQKKTYSLSLSEEHAIKYGLTSWLKTPNRKKRPTSNRSKERNNTIQEICNNSTVNALNKYRKIALERGGECLSTDYINTRSKLHFRCGAGHEWYASASSILHSGSWCLICGHKKGGEKQSDRTFARLQDVLLEKKGYILSSLTNPRTKHRFQCEHGHKWETTPHSIIYRDSWCPYCNGGPGQDPQWQLERLQQVAFEKGGECLSPIYTNNRTKLRFRCIDGHEWQVTPNDVLSGYWCPYCVNKTEALVRQFFECVFDAPFPNTAPVWLQSMDTPRRFLDGYCDSLRLAFEYHGEQHFRHIKHFHERDGEKTLSMQQERDQFVRETCAFHGITLIEIGTLPRDYTKEVLVEWVAAQCEQAAGIKIEPEKIQKFLLLPARVSKLKEIKDIAASKGGECLETKYISSISKMYFRCANGHEFATIPKSIKKGCWCPVCAGCRIVSPLEDIKLIAESKGGECLSTEYVNQRTKLHFRCGVGHEWYARADGMKNNDRWCPVCSGNKLLTPLDELRRIAVEHGGKCLSEGYINNKTKLRFRCEAGHEWNTAASKITSGHWCRLCAAQTKADASRLTISEFQAIAANRGGVCLSTTYNNNKTKLKFRCNSGHEWESTPAGIKRGNWCGICAKNRVENPLCELQEIALTRGGKCLSTSYTGNKAKMTFQCANGHLFEKSANAIKSKGQWCSQC